MLAAATAALLGCGDVLAPGGSVSLSGLLVLPLQNTAPPPATAQRWIRVSSTGTQVISVTHPDTFTTLFAEVRFPPGSLRALNGAPLADGDSVLVTVQPRTGSYGVTLSPAGLEFRASAPPTVRFSYGRYGDFSVADGVATFPDRSAYATALEVWREATITTWTVASGSAPSGTDAVAATAADPGAFLVAARR